MIIFFIFFFALIYSNDFWENTQKSILANTLIFIKAKSWHNIKIESYYMKFIYYNLLFTNALQIATSFTN